MSKQICFYHSADLDGLCSGALIKYYNPEVELIGIDYNQKTDDEIFSICKNANKVFLVDFSFSIDLMKKIRDVTEFIWIDHHKSIINEAIDKGFYTKGLLTPTRSACELVWMFYNNHSDKDMPIAIKYLGIYDSWRRNEDDWEENILPFQFGAKHYITSVDSNLWKELFESKDFMLFNDIKLKGKLFLEYQREQYKQIVNRFGFKCVWQEYTALCCNANAFNDMLFDSIVDDSIDLKITFCQLPNGKWKISLYSNTIDVSIIAKNNGGGGHKGAAGFMVYNINSFLGGLKRIE